MNETINAYNYLNSLIITLIVLCLSIFPVAYARYNNNNFNLVSLSKPRSLFKNYKPWAKRAHWAHQNSFESFILHSPSIILAISLSLQNIQLPAYCLHFAFLHPIFRMFYIIFYISNKPIPRIILWGGSFLCTIIIYINLILVFSSR